MYFEKVKVVVYNLPESHKSMKVAAMLHLLQGNGSMPAEQGVGSVIFPKLTLAADSIYLFRALWECLLHYRMAEFENVKSQPMSISGNEKNI